MQAAGNTWTKLEPWLYRLLVALHLLPIWAAKWFVTLDGPSHLYNARIVRDLLLGDPFFSRFFHLSTYPEPYWTGHAAMAVLLTVLPAWLVEKLLWSTAVVGLAWAFRRFLRGVAPDRPWAALLVMPFLLHYAVRMGFLNFSLSLTVLLLAVAEVWHGLVHGRTRTAVLLPVLLLLYFTHLFTFAVGVGAIAAMLVWAHLPGMALQARGSLRPVLISMALPLVLTIGYFATHRPEQPGTMHVDMVLLWNWLLEGRCWNALGVAGEQLACTLTAVPLLLGGALALLFRAGRGKFRFQPDDFWPLLALGTLASYFLLPDVVGGGSSVSPRLHLLGMLFLAVALAGTELPLRALQLIVALVVVADVYHVRLQHGSAVSLGRECAELMAVQPAVEDRSVLLPLNWSGNWMHSNLSNYLGTGTARVVVLDHFTALAPFNPAQWNPGMLAHGSVGTFATSNHPCVRLAGYGEQAPPGITEVATWKMSAATPDSCWTDVRRQLREQGDTLATSPHQDAVLYQRKP
ncbi:MAG: hypothetical protein KBH07_10980 [Flavobacteriales bacterium]|nr:hypothetical protein [Flavobacteriales bacterium]MBP9080324.1 hypothetical protein [Flavobacteriales bacterium]